MFSETLSLYEATISEILSRIRNPCLSWLTMWLNMISAVT